MKNLTGLTANFFIISLLSATVMVVASPVSAEQMNATFTSSAPILLASTSFNGKPPFNRHAVARQVINNQQAADVSVKFIKWKPPFKRHLQKQDKLHKVQVAQLGEKSSVVMDNTNNVDKKLKGNKPPFKRN